MASVGRIADTVTMTYARSQIAPPGEYGCFHVVTRCVRRAFLCGSVSAPGRTSITGALGSRSEFIFWQSPSLFRSIHMP